MSSKSHWNNGKSETSAACGAGARWGSNHISSNSNVHSQKIDCRKCRQMIEKFLKGLEVES